MANIETLVQKFASYVALSWEPEIAPQQRVWFIVYHPSMERTIEFRLPAFEVAARSATRGWVALDLSAEVSKWLGEHEYRDAYFSKPSALGPALHSFRERLIERIRTRLNQDDADENAVVAITGTGSLFPMARLSEVLQGLAASGLPKGRLAVFFPGDKVGQRYKLLGVGDGWDYLAIPITLNENEQ